MVGYSTGPDRLSEIFRWPRRVLLKVIAAKEHIYWTGRQGFSHAGGAYYFVTELLMWESGGAGEAIHVAEALQFAQAALLASILHEDPSRLVRLRAELRDMGVPLRDAA